MESSLTFLLIWILWLWKSSSLASVAQPPSSSFYWKHFVCSDTGSSQHRTILVMWHRVATGVGWESSPKSQEHAGMQRGAQGCPMGEGCPWWLIHLCWPQVGQVLHLGEVEEREVAGVELKNLWGPLNKLFAPPKLWCHGVKLGF